MRFFAAALIFFGAAYSPAKAQAPEVPHKMQFAGMTLTIRDDARREIQKDVDALTQHGRYYMLKAERAKTYFPIIEKIFEEEHVPVDFKFLVLQESALVADAVSVSNAVGFWQFKDYTAMEMGLRVDRQIDERMNLVSSTRGAAKYLRQNNALFNNWLYALQSYQMGAGGVQRSVGDTKGGASHMEINSETYWYVKKFLAHKVAFENTGPTEALIKVSPYQTTTPKSLKQIAAEVSLDESVLKEYNKWLKTDLVPTDKQYVVLVPVGKLDGDFNKLVLSSSRASKATAVNSAMMVTTEVIRVNGISGIRARSGESVVMLADRAKISLTSFLKYNDIAIDHQVEPNSVYLLGKKKNKAPEEFYKVKPGDNLWSVSQHTGVKLGRLEKYNRITEETRLVAGNIMWLSTTKKDGPVKEIEAVKQDPTVEVVQLNEKETFDWYLKSPVTSETVAVVKVPLTQAVQVPSASEQVPMTTGKMDLPTGNMIVHVVKKGDTFTSIAAQYGVTIGNLLEWNSLNVQNGLHPGETLKVKSDKPAEVNNTVPATERVEKEVIHVVKSSDTLYSVARQFNVTIRDLMEWNDKKDFTLTVGEKLRIITK